MKLRTGVIVVHVDRHAAHYVKAEMDKLFGYERLVNEVIWRYRTFHGQVKDRLARKHDTLTGLLLLQSASPSISSSRPRCWHRSDGKRWERYLTNGNQILGANMPMQDSRFTRFYRRWVRRRGREPGPSDVVYEV